MDTYELCVGDKLWFINKTTKSVDFLVVAYVGRDVFSFRYNGKLFKCSKSYAKGKLFKNISDIPNPVILPKAYPVELEVAPKEQPVKKSVSVSLNNQDKCCDLCQLNVNGTCTEIKKVPCDDFRAIPYISDEEKASWPAYGDATYFRINSGRK